MCVCVYCVCTGSVAVTVDRGRVHHIALDRLQSGELIEEEQEGDVIRGSGKTVTLK